MAENYLLAPQNIQVSSTIKEIEHCNEITAPYALFLSLSQAKALANTHAATLRRSNRVEFRGGTIQKIIKAFYTSPFLWQSNYVDVIAALIDAFYEYKNETLDELCDDELITLMRKHFDETCRGSVDLLVGRDLYKIAHNIRFGITDYADIQDEEEIAYDID